MVYIVPEILSLNQYICKSCQLREQSMTCPQCGRLNPWRHGCYSRQSDRHNPSNTTLNPILIQRYYCPGCHITFSVLPNASPLGVGIYGKRNKQRFY